MGKKYTEDIHILPKGQKKLKAKPKPSQQRSGPYLLVTIIKWSQICTRTIRKCFFEDIIFLAPYPISFPMKTFKMVVNSQLLSKYKFFLAITRKQSTKYCCNLMALYKDYWFIWDGLLHGIHSCNKYKRGNNS